MNVCYNQRIAMERSHIKPICYSRVGRPVSGAQQQDIVRVDHGSIGCVAVCAPDRAIVKSRKHTAALVHVGKAAQPDKTIEVFEITKWTDNAYSESFLRLNELV